MTTKRKRGLLIALVVLIGVCIVSFIGIMILGTLANRDPKVQAAGTARALAISIAQSATPALKPTTAPTSTIAPTITPWPTATTALTATTAPTATMTPQPQPDWGGVSDWILHDGQRIGVKQIEFNASLGSVRAETGKVLVSLYVVAVNDSDSETTFSDSALGLVDGGGEITHGVWLSHKEPIFDGCTLKPGGSCEGWWTTMIVDSPKARADLLFRYDPCLLLCSAMETEIRQK